MSKIFILLCSTFWLALASLAGLQAAAAAAPDLSGAQETDPRLHADGKGWRLDQARITDPKRPRVLLIGDSILGGYQKDVIAALEGKAYVDTWINPYCQSEYYNKLLAEVLAAKGPYDVVHFNMGLNGWQKGRIKEGPFEPLTKAYVEIIKAKLPKARIIWASSRPVTVMGKPTRLDPEINPNIIEQNRMAAKVMREEQVPVNDFYSLLVGRLELARGDQFHWTAPAYKILADTAVRSILEALPAAVAADSVVVYPAAPLPRAPEFTVQANGQEIPVYNAGTFRCAPFAFSGAVQVKVHYLKGPISSFQINPLSKNVTARQEGATLTFSLTRPQKLEVQINGATSQVADGDKLLYLFADAPEANPPQPTDQGILYFGPGTHSPEGGVLRIGDADPYSALYVAPGALLKAALIIKRSKPFKIYGRGFIQNPCTTKPPKGKGQFAVKFESCKGLVMEDVIFFDSIWHGIKFFGGRDNLVRNVKALHYVVNSDGISFHGAAAHNVVEDCLIIGNDNLIVIGGARPTESMRDNVVRRCTFIKSSYAGNWAFPQGDGPIGPGNVVEDCDVVRCNGEVGLVRMFWARPTTVDNLIFQNIRVQSLAGYQPNPKKSNLNRFLSLESGDPQYQRTMTFRNIYLPSAQTSFISPGRWTIIFDHVYVNGKAATCDADLHLTKGAGAVTKYIY